MTAAEIEDILRQRVLRALQAGSLEVGERLPSARQYAAEFGVDYRVVLAAYKALVADGLVELRARGGVYVARDAGAGAELGLPEHWIEELFVQGLARDIPMRDLAEWLRRCAETLRLRVAVLGTTEEQVAGLCREVRDDYGLEPVPADARAVQNPPASLRSTAIVIAMRAVEATARVLAEELGVPIVIVEARPDLAGSEWRLVLRRPAYVVVEDERAELVVRRFLAEVPNAKNLRVLVLGRDAVEHIPDGAPTYVTRAARAAMRGLRVAGRILPSPRLLAGETARALVRFIVRRNLEALRAGAR